MCRGITSHSSHYRSFRGRFLQARWPNQQCQSTEGNQLVKENHAINCSDAKFLARRSHSKTRQLKGSICTWKELNSTNGDGGASNLPISVCWSRDHRHVTMPDAFRRWRTKRRRSYNFYCFDCVICTVARYSHAADLSFTPRAHVNHSASIDDRGDLQYFKAQPENIFSSRNGIL